MLRTSDCDRIQIGTIYIQMSLHQLRLRLAVNVMLLSILLHVFSDERF